MPEPSQETGRGDHRRRGWCIATLVVASILVAVSIWVWIVHREIVRMETHDEKEGAPGRFCQVGKYLLHVQTAGGEQETSRPLWLIHGFDVRGGLQWREVSEILSRERRVFVPDLLGFGHSQRVQLPVREYSHAGQAALLACLIEDMGLQSVDLAGCSYGGGVAAQLALDYPHIVRRLVIVDGQVYRLGGGIFQAMGKLPCGIGPALSRKVLVSPFSKEPVARIRGTTGALQAFNKVAIDARIPKDLHELRLPVLILWGEKDRLFPLSEAGRLLQELPNATLEIIPGAGHSPHADRPEEVARRIRVFLE